MRIENRSAFHPTAKLLPVIDFVLEYTGYSSLATLRLTDMKNAAGFSGGYACKHRQDGHDLTLVAPSIVDIQLSRACRYPKTTVHVPELGEVQVRSFEEEFLLVLAHELRHVDQFWGRRFTDEAAAELDAERFAIKILKAWRKRATAPVRKAA